MATQSGRSDTGGLPAGLLAGVEAALGDEPDADRVLFVDRARRYWPDLIRGLQLIYGPDAEGVAERALGIAVKAFSARSAELRLLDLRRVSDPGWFQRPAMLGYSCYTERFAGSLEGVAARADYLAELGVGYLHLMPLLTPRPRPNDGGYAVADYRQVRPDLGTMEDLSRLAGVLRRQGISLTLDLVLNHVAYEHEWAQRARQGDPRYRGYFHVFPDRERPDAYEETLPEIFPDQAPGSFSWDDQLDGWVWTTFNTWQWDLNWHNPEVFCEFSDIVLFLANHGVECLRLDAIAFLWKRLGTSCQNQPEVHAITQALHAVTRIAAPGLLFKAEAIVGPQDLPAYLGVGEYAGKVSDLAYHNILMVQVWSSLATGDARLAQVALRGLPTQPASTSWATYVRCHDDIGWAIADSDAAAVGWQGHAHRHFLSSWYSGEFAGSPARGLVFQYNPINNDRRISGSAASLAGLENALTRGDPQDAERSLQRLLLAHAIVLSFGGIPLIYMGDELALCNDYSYRHDPDHADDNRWVHRPVMPWNIAERRHRPGTLEHAIWHRLRHLISVRSGLPAMDAAVPAEVLPLDHEGVLGWLRPHPYAPLVALHNVAGREHRWPRYAVPLDGTLRDAITGAEPQYRDGELVLGAYQALWLTAP